MIGGTSARGLGVTGQDAVPNDSVTLGTVHDEKEAVGGSKDQVVFYHLNADDSPIVFVSIIEHLQGRVRQCGLSQK